MERDELIQDIAASLYERRDRIRSGGLEDQYRLVEEFVDDLEGEFHKMPLKPLHGTVFTPG